MNQTRDRIAKHIRGHPGVHFNALVAGLDLAPGQVQYHLRELIDRNVIVREQLYGRTHYFDPEYDEWERGAFALVRRETARDVLASLLVDGPSRPAKVAENLDIARSTLEWHLDHLVEQDLVEKRRNDSGRVTLLLCQPEATERLLREMTPSLPDRFVDRFTRLFDRLLDDV